MSRVADMTLPARRHIPGENARPDDTLFDAIKAAAPAVTSCATGAENLTWRYGIRLLNAGYFWEAHEVLELVWLNAAPNSRERYLVQGVIHLANGRLKDVMGRANARRRLATLSRDAFAAAFPAGNGMLMGIDASNAQNAAADLMQGAAAAPLSVYGEI